MRCYGCSEKEADQLTLTYREHYRQGALLNAVPYDGILETCRKLSEMDLLLAVATSKPRYFAEQILAHFCFNRYITVVHGADMAGKLTKADLIKLCISDFTPENCLMIGDTEHDAKGAQEAGVPFLGVSYGFGNAVEMGKYPAVAVINHPIEILKYVSDEREKKPNG